MTTRGATSYTLASCTTIACMCAHAQVWNHFDAQECVGEPTGVTVQLDNGVRGFIALRDLSDKEVKDPSDRVKRGMTIHARIQRIDIVNFKVMLSSKTSDLMNEEGKWG